MEKLKLIKESLSALEQNIENVEEVRWKVCLPLDIQSCICPMPTSLLETAGIPPIVLCL
jgi:hypothetical protein